MLWKKPANLRYVDLCIYIDENITKIVTPGEYPDVENTIYNYLWLLVKALAIKKGMFQNFQDYDPYAFYAANRLYFALRKNQVNQGKVIKGKLIRPIKSCLNYTKALLYPMKVEYQREAYREIIDEEFASKKFDSQLFREQLKDSIAESQTDSQTLQMYLADTFKNSNEILKEVLKKIPFKPDSLDYKKIKISILLNCIYNLKTKHRLIVDSAPIILWKLPKSMSSYIKLLIREFNTELAKEASDCYHYVMLSNDDAEKILTYREDYDYDEQY